MINSVFYEQNLICLPIKIKSDCKYVSVKTLLLLCLYGHSSAEQEESWKEEPGHY